MAENHVDLRSLSVPIQVTGAQADLLRRYEDSRRNFYLKMFNRALYDQSERVKPVIIRHYGGKGVHFSGKIRAAK